MLEVYKRDEHNGKLKVLVTFNSYNELFTHVGYRYDFSYYFGYIDTARHDDRAAGFGDHGRTPDHPRLTDNWAWWKESHYCYVLYENGKFVTPDRIVGLHRIWRDNKKETRRFRYRYWRRKAYGSFRYPHSMQERRMVQAWDGEENAPKVRAARNLRHLPDAWNDNWGHSDRSWKTQSKRKHQWKEKLCK